MAENNLNSETLKQFTDKMFDNIDTKFNNSDSNLQKMIKESNIQDKKVLLLLEENAKSEGKYKQSVDKLFNEYVKEMKFSEKDRSKIENLLEESNKLSELTLQKRDKERAEEARKNPLTAFSHAIKDFGENKSFKEASITLSKSLKEGMSFKNMAKGAMHGAGVALDSPVLNLLASEISGESKSAQELNSKELDLAERLDALEGSSKTEDNFKNNARKNKSVIDDLKSVIETDGVTATNSMDLINKLEMIEENTESTYVDLGSELENIHDELNAQTKIFKEQLFMQKDSRDDKKSLGAQEESEISLADKPLEKENKEDFGALGDSIGGLFGEKGGKKGKGRFSGLKNMAKSLGSVTTSLTTFGKFVPMIGAAVAGITAVFSTVSGFLNTNENLDLAEGQEATGGQKLASSAGSLLNTVSMGAIDEKDASKVLDWKMRSLGTQDDSGKSALVTGELAKQGAIDLEWLGKSKIKDWSTIEKLPKGKVRAVYDYADWDTETRSRLIDILNKKAKEPVSGVAQEEDFYIAAELANQDKMDKELDEAGVLASSSTPLPDNITTQAPVQPVVNVAPTPVVVQQAPEKTKKMDNMSLDDKISLTGIKLGRGL